MSWKQRDLYEKYKRALKEKIHGHEQLKEIFNNLLTSLSEMSN